MWIILSNGKINKFLNKKNQRNYEFFQKTNRIIFKFIFTKRHSLWILIRVLLSRILVTIAIRLVVSVSAIVVCICSVHKIKTKKRIQNWNKNHSNIVQNIHFSRIHMAAHAHFLSSNLHAHVHSIFAFCLRHEIVFAHCIFYTKTICYNLAKQTGVYRPESF